jgi:hypothetical protein
VRERARSRDVERFVNSRVNSVCERDTVRETDMAEREIEGVREQRT